jgi:SsrA-binding protein
MKIINKNYYNDYRELESFEAGIALKGGEVKEIKNNNCKLEGAYVKILNNGVFLINANITPYKYTFAPGYDKTRSRQLLLHKKEILRLETKMRKGNLTLAPKSIYSKGRLIKLQVGLVAGLKETDKKRLVKGRETKMEQKKMLKEMMKS